MPINSIYFFLRNLTYFFLSLAFFSQSSCFSAFCDLSDFGNHWRFGFQEPAANCIITLIKLHNFLIFWLIFVGCFVFWMLSRAICLFSASAKRIPFVVKTFTHYKKIEQLWTLIPIGILVVMLVPSIIVIYGSTPTKQYDLLLKIVGHQWYWSYTFPHEEEGLLVKNNFVRFDAYPVSPPDAFPINKILLSENIFTSEVERKLYILFDQRYPRLLETDTIVSLPVNFIVKVLITSADVLHSWTVPAFGVKIDACPGRLNQFDFVPLRRGLFFGQCSEFCGYNHVNMPIVVETTSLEDWVLDFMYDLQRVPKTSRLYKILQTTDLV